MKTYNFTLNIHRTLSTLHANDEEAADFATSHLGGVDQFNDVYCVDWALASTLRVIRDCQMTVNVAPSTEDI